MGAPAPAAFSLMRRRVLAAPAKQGVIAWPNSRFRRTARSGRAATYTRRGGQAAEDVQDLSLRPRQRRQSALRHATRSTSTNAGRWSSTRSSRSRMRSTRRLTFRRSCREGICGSCAMNMDGTQRPRLHHRDRGSEGRGADHAAAAHGRGQGPGPRLHPFLRPICLDPAVAEDGDARAVGQGAAAVARGPGEARRPLRVHPVRLLLDQLPELLVELATSSSARRSCSRPIAGSPTAATRRPASGSTSSRTRSASIAATRS